MSDTKEFREELLIQFTKAALGAHAKALACFQALAKSVGGVPDDVIDDYLHFFEGEDALELDNNLMQEIDDETWFPADATEYAQRFIALSCNVAG